MDMMQKAYLSRFADEIEGDTTLGHFLRVGGAIDLTGVQFKAWFVLLTASDEEGVACISTEAIAALIGSNAEYTTAALRVVEQKGYCRLLTKGGPQTGPSKRKIVFPGEVEEVK